MLERLFEQFIKDKTYIQNCRPKTIEYFHQSFKTLADVLGKQILPTEETLKQFVAKKREAGMSVG